MAAGLTYSGATADRRMRPMGMAVANTRTESASARVTMKITDANLRVLDPEPPLEQRVRRDQLPLEVAWEECIGDDNASDDVPCRDLEKREITEIGQARYADERDRAGLRCDDRDEDGPPRNCVVGDEVVARIALRPAESDAKGGRAGEIQNDDDGVERVKDGRHGGGKWGGRDDRRRAASERRWQGSGIRGQENDNKHRGPVTIRCDWPSHFVP